MTHLRSITSPGQLINGNVIVVAVVVVVAVTAAVVNSLTNVAI
jgi:hypothetical protein